MRGIRGSVKHTSVQVGNPSRHAQRLEAARRQAAGEVADDQEAVNVYVASSGTKPGDDDTLWWPVTYEVIPRLSI